MKHSFIAITATPQEMAKRPIVLISSRVIGSNGVIIAM
jgi:hypothetical protein